MDALQSWWKRQGGGGQGGPSAAMRENAAWPLVDRATADILLAEDFAANLEVSDFCNASVEHATLVARAIVERLRCRSPKSVKLALSLVEMCVKNGNASALHTLGGTREFMTVVAEVATGKTSSFASTIPGADTPQVWLEVQERALEVIQELGQLMQDRPTYPGFYETYASLTARGIIFPVRDAAPAAALAADPVAFGAQHSSRDNSSGGVRAADIDKLEHDLSVLECKLQVADHLLGENLYGDSEEMLDVLDFLLQCKPRLCELIEASAQGLLSDMFFKSCLQMNDRLCATVDRIQILPSKPRDALVDSEEVDLFAQGGDEPRESSLTTDSASEALFETAKPPSSREQRPSPIVVPKLRAPRTATAQAPPKLSSQQQQQQQQQQQLQQEQPQPSDQPSQWPVDAPKAKSSAHAGDDFASNPFDFFSETPEPESAKQGHAEDAPLVPRSAQSENEESSLLK